MMEAARRMQVSQYLFTSSIGVYSPSEIFFEDDVWKSFPSDHDKYAGWAKRMGELQVEAYKKEFDFESLHIVRPANIYGPHMNFNDNNSMVVAALIKRADKSENPFIVWGNGENIRDFIYSEDVASGMIKVVEKYNHSDEITSPAKYTMSTMRDPNRSARIPAGNPASPRNKIWMVTNCPNWTKEIENSFSNITKIAGKIMVMA